MTESLVYVGAPGSPYTRKMRALLRYRRIPNRLVLRGRPEAVALPRPKVELLPTFYLPGPDGALEPHTDSTPLLRRFERDYPGREARPTSPVLAFLDSLLEDFADEWVTKAMFHYRWAFAPDVAKASAVLPLWSGVDRTDAEVAPLSKLFAERQIGRLGVVGSNEVTAPLIESSYERTLVALDAHLQTQPFLLGQRPAACDFALYGQLTQLVGFDPTPAAIAIETAPRVYAWVETVEDLSGLEPPRDGWIAPDAVPETLRALLGEAGRGYVPVMLANADAVMRGADQVEAEVDGARWTQTPFRYQAKCVAWLREEFQALAGEDRALLLRALDGTGCERLLA